MTQSENDCLVEEVSSLIGKRVVVTVPPSTDEEEYFIVSQELADASEKRITILAPIIRDLKGVHCGEDYQVHIGKKPSQQVVTYRLIRIES